MLISFADAVAAVCAEVRSPRRRRGRKSSRYMPMWLGADKVVPIIASVAMAKMVSRAERRRHRRGQAAGTSERRRRSFSSRRQTRWTSPSRRRRHRRRRRGGVLYARRAGRPAQRAFSSRRSAPCMKTTRRKSSRQTTSPHHDGQRLDTRAQPENALSRRYARQNTPTCRTKARAARRGGSSRFRGRQRNGCFLAGQVAGLITRAAGGGIIREYSTKPSRPKGGQMGNSACFPGQGAQAGMGEACTG